MQSTPISKSSTSNEPHEAMLLELLAVIHRDGGQYTKLAGLQASYTDAKAKVEALLRLARSRNRSDVA